MHVFTCMSDFKGYLFCSVKITFLFREPPVTLNAIRDAKVTAFERTVTALLRVSQKKLKLYFSKLWLKASRILEQKFFLEKIFFLKLKTKDQCALLKERVNLCKINFLVMDLRCKTN